MTNETNFKIADGFFSHDGENIGMADFADVDVSDISSNGFEPLPDGVYKLTPEVELKPVERTDKETKEKYQVPQVVITSNIDEVISGNADPEKTVGKKHIEYFTLNVRSQQAYEISVGQLKNYAAKLGADEKSLTNIKAILNAINGVTHTARIETKERNGYSNTAVVQKTIKVEAEVA